MEQDEYKRLLEKYKEKVKEEFGEHAISKPAKITSKEYTEFKEELYPARYSWYEKAGNFSGEVLKLKVDASKAGVMQKDLDTCHLNTTPAGVISFSILAPLLVMVFGSLIAYALPVLFGLPSMFPLVALVAFGGLLMIPALRSIPKFMANTWRMKASNQMVQSILYLVTYMRHTSNLERAIEFAADHLDSPLSLDFRKILWDAETQKYSTIRDSANAYLESWKEANQEFVEAFHLVESSLFEPSEDRRLSLLDKALDVILNGTYENMLHYAHSLQSPINMLNMLGIILPILGLVILPLVVSFMSGGGSSPFISAIYISVLYNVGLPIGVFYLGKVILSKRPTGYGATDIGENPAVRRFRNVNLNLGKKLVISINPLYFSMMVLLVGVIIGFSPLILHSIDKNFEIQDEEGTFKFLDYICPPENPNCDIAKKLGPYGVGGTLMSLVVIAALQERD
ncbi:hypothetical protein HZC32_00300 [Candidatus Woesearchaeota archaeon]|nr:hypothetical protein [Candidatus Woesearchaeota archaeon]